MFMTILAVALAGSVAPASAPDADAMQQLSPPWDTIAFEMKSWGRPQVSWQISPTGEGAWIEAVHEDGAPFDEYDLAWHTLDAGQEGYGKVAALLADIPIPAPVSTDCENYITDQPYGTLRLTRGATTVELAYNAGCMDEEYAAFLSSLRATNELVGEWGRESPVSQTEPGPQD